MHTVSKLSPQEFNTAPVVTTLQMATLAGSLAWLIGPLRQAMATAAQCFGFISAQRRQEFLEEVKSQAAEQGYTALEVSGELIDMLLIRRQERVVVMARSREWFAGDHTQLVMDLMQADAAWVLDRRSLAAQDRAARDRQGLIKTVQRQFVADALPA